MFLPARMRRLLVGGHRDHLPTVIELLHREGAVHLEDYVDPTGTTSIGTPLEAGAEVSDLLVRVRGLRKALACEDIGPSGTVRDAAAQVAASEGAAQSIIQKATEIRAQRAAVDAEEAALRPFATLDVELSALTTLRSVKVFLGTTREDPTVAVQTSKFEHELQVARSDAGFAVALIVAAKDSARAEQVLAASGFSAATLPAGRGGSPAARLAALAAEAKRLSQAQAASEADLAQLRAEWAGPLAALEHHLAAEVEKTQAPLKFAVTETTFHIEGWVPKAAALRVRAALDEKLGDSLYVEDLGDAPVAASAADPAHDRDEHHATTAKEEPPVHLENKGPARPYEFLLGLLGKPRYQEIDPTKLMLFFFPLFFGLMVGDLAVGLIIVAFGHYLKTHHLFGIGGPAVGRVLVMGGIMAAIVGGVVFGEALGIHFVTPEPEEPGAAKDISWEEILGLQVPSEGFLHKTGVENAAAAEDEATQRDEPGGLLGVLKPYTDEHLSVNGWFNLGYYSKIHDIQALLVWAVLIGLVHLILGFALGIRNVYVRHGATLAIQEKVAWLTFMGGAALAVWGLVAANTITTLAGTGIVLVSIALLWMGAAHVLGAGYVAVLEIFSLLGNILSYTRLAAIGASKAGMAVAFAAIGFDTLGGGNIHSVVGWIVYLLGFVLLIALSILAGGLQSLRLQFVEFFGKFYVGGGRPYVPFGRRAP